MIEEPERMSVDEIYGKLTFYDLTQGVIAGGFNTNYEYFALEDVYEWSETSKELCISYGMSPPTPYDRNIEAPFYIPGPTKTVGELRNQLAKYAKEEWKSLAGVYDGEHFPIAQVDTITAPASGFLTYHVDGSAGNEYRMLRVHDDLQIVVLRYTL